jgi:hypothetical protein
VAWIKFDKDLIDDPRVLHAAEVLAERYTLSVERVSGPGFAVGSDVSEQEAVTIMRNAVTGALLTLWVYADTHIRNGDELPISVTAVDRMVGIDGFCDIIGEDWIRSDNYGTTVVLPGYCEKNGLISKDKRNASNAERQRKYRERQRLLSNASHNAVSNAVTSNAVTLLDQDLDQDLKEEKPNRASRLPASWVPSDSLKAWVSENRPDIDLAATVANFRDHWSAASGARARKHDWDAAFRTWARNERSAAKAAQKISVDL